MNNDHPRLTPKSAQVLKLIAAGHSHAQIVDSHEGLNYHDIFFAAEEAVWLDERLGMAGETPLEPDKAGARPTGVSAMAQAKMRYPRAYAAWTESEDAQLKSMYAAGKSRKEAAEWFQRQPSAIRSRLAKLGLI